MILPFHPLVVNVRDAEYDVYVGRIASYGDPLWGNPYRAGRDGTLEEVLAMYEQYVMMVPYLRSRIPLLAGKRLGCHCRGKNEGCHANFLAWRSNRAHVVQPRRRTPCSSSTPSS